MKKITLETIYDALTTFGFEDKDVLDEIQKELNKGQAKKDANAQAYEAMHDVIIGSLSDTPVTCAELFENIESDLPMGTTKNKVNYALTHLWQDEIVVIPGKPNTYRKA